MGVGDISVGLTTAAAFLGFKVAALDTTIDNRRSQDVPIGDLYATFVVPVTNTIE